MPKLDIALTPDEVDAYLGAQRTIRLATTSPTGMLHVIPLWFVWLDGRVFMNSTLGNTTLRNLQRNPVAAGVVDDGQMYDELRGVLVQGRVSWEEGAPDQVEAAWSEKYLGGNPVPFGRWKNRVWFRLDPDRLSSWDFRKIPEARARRRSEVG
jgi:nitroimidazol reductase NimA-like FMN-containing flavoprotein (pyridoxamine 5'-phosphate oxidase superfamily)